MPPPRRPVIKKGQPNEELDPRNIEEMMKNTTKSTEYGKSFYHNNHLEKLWSKIMHINIFLAERESKMRDFTTSLPLFCFVVRNPRLLMLGS